MPPGAFGDAQNLVPIRNTMNEIQNLPPTDGPAPLHALRPLDPDDEKIRLRLTCAWCGEVIEDGPGPVSHGMCGNCRAAFLATLPDA
jgi:hypothetical protein